MSERRRIYVVYSWAARTRNGMGSMTLDLPCLPGHSEETRLRYDQVEGFQKKVLRYVQADTPDVTGVVLINWIWLDPSPAPEVSHA